MKESLLHFIWKNKAFDNRHLHSTQGEKIEVLHYGFHNHDAGPDFLNARVQINDTIWAGNIELHIRSSDWFNHGHDSDKAYNNVVLHVVLIDDLPENPVCSTLELQDRLSDRIIEQYEYLEAAKKWIPCQDKIDSVSSFDKKMWLKRVLIERLERKSDDIKQFLQTNNSDWSESFYVFLARNLGMKVNGQPLFNLAKRTPLKLLSHYQSNLFQLESILFGQAGMLNEFYSDSYPESLRKEYLFLAKKHKLKGIDGSEWNFLRLRPANFPSLRIAQLSKLIYNSKHLFSSILQTKDLKILDELLKAQASEYWKNHYRFDKRSKNTLRPVIGQSARNNIIINTVIPFLFLYGRERGKEELVERALGFLEELPKENNKILRKWVELDLPNNNAFESQALLQLKKQYCDEKRCLECQIGRKILLN